MFSLNGKYINEGETADNGSPPSTLYTVPVYGTAKHPSLFTYVHILSFHEINPFMIANYCVSH